MREGGGKRDMMSFDGDMVVDIRSLVRILVHQSYSECLKL